MRTVIYHFFFFIKTSKVRVKTVCYHLLEIFSFIFLNVCLFIFRNTKEFMTVCGISSTSAGAIPQFLIFNGLVTLLI